jgi:hypothetical protein
MTKRYHGSTSLGLGCYVALLLLCAGCKDDKHLVEQAKSAATAEQWHAWAAKVLERSRTNSNPIPRSDWPAFIQRIKAPCTEWQLVTGRNGSTSNISLVSIGGFCSFGIDIGASSFVEPKHPNEHSVRVYPGVYVVSN